MNTLQIYRDDGPLARVIGAASAPLRAGEVPLTLVAAAVLGAILALVDRPAPAVAVGAGVALAVLLGSAGASREHDGRFSWVVPAVLRALEYAFLIRLTALVEPDAMPLCFALLAALAFHHYDIVYRLRQQGAAPPAWTRAVGGGWEGRLVIASLLAAAGALGTGMLVAAVGLAAVYVTESVLSWSRYARAARPAVIDDEESEDE